MTEIARVLRIAMRGPLNVNDERGWEAFILIDLKVNKIRFYSIELLWHFWPAWYPFRGAYGV